MLAIQDRRIMQIGYVVRDLEKSAIEYSRRLGIGPWEVYTTCPPDLREALYRGKPIDHKFLIALAGIERPSWNSFSQ